MAGARPRSVARTRALLVHPCPSCADNVNPVCKEILEDAGHRVTEAGALSKEDLIRELPKYDGIVVRSSSYLTAEVLEAAGSRLKVCLRGLEREWGGGAR